MHGLSTVLLTTHIQTVAAFRNDKQSQAREHNKSND
jgi:hypothetical protein